MRCALIRRELAGSVPLIGFAGSPWTVATYMIEGGGSRDFAHIKGAAHGDPKALHGLLEKLARATTDYLNAQVEAGAQAVMIFDTWGGVLSTPEYLEFSLAYMEQIVAGLMREHDGRRVPLDPVHKGRRRLARAHGGTGADALGVDWTTELSAARQAVGDRVALQGNLDPAALFESPEAIRAHVARVLESYGHGAGPRLQSRPWHPAGRRSGERRGNDLSRARTLARLPLLNVLRLTDALRPSRSADTR